MNFKDLSDIHIKIEELQDSLAHGTPRPLSTASDSTASDRMTVSSFRPFVVPY